MGYRHIMIANGTLPEKSELPQWFMDKYNHCIDFSGSYWKSYTEYKMEMSFATIKDDFQKLLQEVNIDDDDQIQLVFFSEEGLWQYGKIDITHVDITKDYINENEMIKSD